jgi:hypothetical protein
LLRENIVAFRQIPSLVDWRKALFFNNNQIFPYDVLVDNVSAIVSNDLEWTTFSMILQEFLALNAAFGWILSHYPGQVGWTQPTCFVSDAWSNAD